MTLSFLPGADSDEQYSNIIFFAKGGMGEIYKANDNINQTEVAIKIIPIGDEVEEELLLREIKVSSELQADNIVKTHYTGEVEVANTKYFYIVQDFYPNGNMRRIIKKGIPLEECFEMMLDILNGLKTVHTKVVHRDLKPENILIDTNSHLVITDFGLAKFINEKTKTHSFKGAGTIPYMAPECWLFEENSIQMDIYSLGILFYELLTGEFPFNARTEKDWRDCHLYETLPDISKCRPETPTKIKQIISKMTQKRAKNRYRNTDEIIAALKESIQQTQESNQAIEHLASIGHAKTEQLKSEQLKRQQEQERIDEYKKFLNYHITELIDRMKVIVGQINNRLEENKIALKEHVYNGYLTERSFSISINHMFASFKFYEHNVIEEYEDMRNENYKRHQVDQYGFMVSPIPDSIFKQKSIIYLGMVETNFINPILQEKFGFNLALVKKEGDTYGTWYIASFEDSGFARSNRKEFALDLEEFLQEFEKSFIMHNLSVEFRELRDDDLHRVIEEILRA
jgi:serine/threonine protein kinase